MGCCTESDTTSMSQGELLSAEPYFNGLPHGIAKQFDNGKLIGTYTMKHGTGLDLWRGVAEDGTIRLHEARYKKDGRWHGFEWWLNHEDQESCWQECHYWTISDTASSDGGTWMGGRAGVIRDIGFTIGVSPSDSTFERAPKIHLCRHSAKRITVLSGNYPRK
jgi:hypothetical protein